MRLRPVASLIFSFAFFTMVPRANSRWPAGRSGEELVHARTRPAGQIYGSLRTSTSPTSGLHVLRCISDTNYSRSTPALPSSYEKPRRPSFWLKTKQNCGQEKHCGEAPSTLPRVGRVRSLPRTPPQRLCYTVASAKIGSESANIMERGPLAACLKFTSARDCLAW